MHQGLLTLLGVTTDGPVKGLCLHHKRPWIVAGLSNGMIEIWNYNARLLLNEFQGHRGSVQSVQFSITFPLIVSGGCDGKIKVWDYDDICSLRSTFTLEGHSASVNDVQLHLELPWIVSASDDCTVRLWNWVSRSCIAVLTNHRGAVTSSSFHPGKDLILSSSLDQDLCIWDVAGLRDNAISCVDGIQKSRFAFLRRLSKKKDGARLKNVLRGHTSGVVRAIFHPIIPVIFSVSTDCSVYSWKMEETLGTCKHQTVYPQATGVPLLAYSTKMNSVMSTLDDEKIYLHNGCGRPGKRNEVFHIHQKHLLSLCSHPTKEVFAIGHTTGFTVIRHVREPPAFSEFNNILYYVKDKILWSYDYSRKEGAHIVLGPIDDLPDPTFLPIVVTLSCSPQGNAALVCFNSKGYRLVLLNGDSSNKSKNNAIAAKGDGLSTVFVAPDRYAVLIRSDTTKEKILSVRTLANEVVSQCVLPGDIDAISSYGGLGNHLLCKATDRVVMFDLQQQTVVSELGISSVCYIFWMGGGDKKATVVALVGKYFITMANQKLQCLWTFDEANVIESGMWDHENCGVFIYKTWKHIKYCLVNGESGTIMEYKEPLYITRISGSTIYGLGEDGAVRAIDVDATEYVMKSSIFNKDYMKQCCLCLC